MPGTPDPFDESSPPDPPLGWEASPPNPDSIDPFEGVDDEDGSDFTVETRGSPAPLPPVDDTGGEDDPFEVDEAPRRAPPGPIADPERPILPCNTTATIAGESIPTVLAPSMPTSTWRGAPEGAAGETHTIQLGPIELQTALDCLPGAPLLVLGRDVLAGRVLVEP